MNGCEAMEKVANKVTSEVGVGSNKKVFLPKTGELVDATTESYIYQVRLPDALMSQLSFQHAKDNAYLSWVDGALTYQQSGMSKCVFKGRTFGPRICGKYFLLFFQKTSHQRN